MALRRKCHGIATAYRWNRRRGKSGSPFANSSARIARMSSASQTPPFRKRRLQAYRGRGDVYAWLRAHCHQVAERLAGGNVSWTSIAAEMARHRVMGREGGAPTPNAVLRVWQRVCRDLETLGESPAERRARPKPPSRFPKDWKPEAFRTSAPVPVGPAAAPPASPQPYDPVRRREQIRRMINERSGIKE